MPGSPLKTSEGGKLGPQAEGGRTIRFETRRKHYFDGFNSQKSKLSLFPDPQDRKWFAVGLVKAKKR